MNTQELLASLEALKQHTYTPNSFYDGLIEYVTKLNALLSGDILIKAYFDPLEDVELDTMNAGEMSQDIMVQIEDSEGNVLDMFNGDIAVALVTSGSGVAGDEDGSPITSLAIVNGVATFTVYYSGTWVNEETTKLTLGTGASYLGFSLTAVGPSDLLSVEPVA
jgi:hypothetical protein